MVVLKALDDEDDGRKPFKLSFIDKKPPGQSNIHINRPLNIPHVVTTKFYTKYRENERHEELVNTYLEKLKVRSPREKYQDPITENQKYGWYQIQLTDADRTDRRLFFHKRTDVIVGEHLMNYAKIRD